MILKVLAQNGFNYVQKYRIKKYNIKRGQG